MDALKEIKGDVEYIHKMGSVSGKLMDTNDPDKQIIVVPEGYELKTLEKERDYPKRKIQTVSMCRVDSFIEYVDEHKNPYTRVFVNEEPNGTKFTALIDYHETGGGKASYNDHVCTLELQHSKEFLDFKQNNGVSFLQVDFAEFVEDHAHCITKPSAAEMLEIALTLEAVKGANFRSGVRLNNGTVQIKYEETIDAKAGQKGQLEIPDSFKLSLIPFKGGASAEMNAALRYRINNGTLVFLFKILDLQRTIDSALEDTAKKIREELDLPVFFGKAL